MIRLSVLSVVGWTPEFFGCLEYIVSRGHPSRTHTRGNSAAHVCSLQSNKFNFLFIPNDWYDFYLIFYAFSSNFQ